MLFKTYITSNPNVNAVLRSFPEDVEVNIRMSPCSQILLMPSI